MSVADCFKKGFERIGDYAYESITLRKQTITYNNQDDPVRTNEDSTVNAIVQIMTLDDVQEYGEELRVGDAVFFLNSNVSLAEEENVTYYIIHNSITYEIISIVPEWVAGTMIFQECHARRLEYL